jgi:hypothetical protein
MAPLMQPLFLMTQPPRPRPRSRLSAAKSPSPTRTQGDSAKSPPASEFTRRDATGHLAPRYADDLHANSLASAEDHGVDRAFLRTSRSLRAPLAMELGREAVMTMTSAEDQSDLLQGEPLELGQEVGGPFVPTTAARELAPGTDASNPPDATREPFPTT